MPLSAAGALSVVIIFLLEGMVDKDEVESAPDICYEEFVRVLKLMMIDNW